MTSDCRRDTVLLDWLAIRADLDFMSRSYKMDRNLHHIDRVYTKYSNDYLTLPVMADFSFGGKRLRGHAYGGVYGAFWMKARTEGTTFWMTDYYIYFDDFNESRPFNSEDRRLTAGGVGGLRVSYAFPNVWKKWAVLSLPSMRCITTTLSVTTKAILI